ncbi:3498_t:CDS:2, partial [Rhizophagus irregularis]
MADMERSSKKRGKGRKTNSITQTTRVPLRSLRSQRQFNDVRQDNPERNSQDDHQESLQNHEIHDQQIHVPDKEKVTNEEEEDSSDVSEENESETPRKYRKNDTDNLMPKAKKTTESEKEEYYIIPIKFLEKLNNQNKVLWKNQLKQEKRLEDIKQILLKIH